MVILLEYINQNTVMNGWITFLAVSFKFLLQIMAYLKKNKRTKQTNKNPTSDLDQSGFLKNECTRFPTPKTSILKYYVDSKKLIASSHEM